MDNKKITFHTTIKKTATQQPIETTWCVFASDYNSVQVEFVVSDLRPDEIRTVNPTIVLIMEDGSTVQRTKEHIVQKNNVFSYKLKDNEGKHTGVVKAQLKLTTVTGETYMSNIYTFTILESLDSVPVSKEFVIDDIQNILQEVKHHITHIFKDEETRKQVFEEFIKNATLNEKQREAWFNQSQQTRASLFQVFMDEAGEVLKDAQQVKDLFDELTETGIIETNIREKLGELETSYAPRLTTLEQNDVSLTAQLQQTEQELSSQLAGNESRLSEIETVFRNDSDNPVLGYTGNGVALNLRACNIAGGGMFHYENIIGGSVATVGNSGLSNVVWTLLPYDATKTYTIGEMCTSSGIPYRCKLQSLGNLPTNATYWDKAETSLSRILGGYDNVVNGVTNSVDGDHCYIESPSNHSVISGGALHKIINGINSGIFGGTQNEITIGNHSFIFGGNENTSVGDFSVILGGAGNKATKSYSLVSGSGAVATILGEKARSVGKFAVAGDAQVSSFVIKAKTTSASNGYLQSFGDFPVVPPNTTWAVNLDIVARRTDVIGEAMMIKASGLAYRNGDSSAVMIGTPIIEYVYKSTELPWEITVTIINNSFAVTVTGEAGKKIQWVADMRVVATAG